MWPSLIVTKRQLLQAPIYSNLNERENYELLKCESFTEVRAYFLCYTQSLRTVSQLLFQVLKIELCSVIKLHLESFKGPNLNPHIIFSHIIFMCAACQ